MLAIGSQFLVVLSHLFVRQRVQVLVVRTEEQIPQDGTPVAHHRVLVLQGRLHDGVDQDLQRKTTTFVNASVHCCSSHRAFSNSNRIKKKKKQKKNTAILIMQHTR